MIRQDTQNPVREAESIVAPARDKKRYVTPGDLRETLCLGSVKALRERLARWKGAGLTVRTNGLRTSGLRYWLPDIDKAIEAEQELAAK